MSGKYYYGIMKKIMKIVGIVPSTSSPYLRFGIFRLGMPILMTDARNLGYQAIMVDENIAPIDLNWLKKEIKEADLIVFSSITATYNRTLWYRDWIRNELALSPPMAIGGIHSTFEAEKVLDDGFDFVFRHEGELIFPKFLEVFEGKGDFSTVPNLCWKRNGEKIFNPVSSLQPNLDQVTFPDFLDKNLFPQWNKSCMAVIETSRSCPFQCNFCSVYPMFKAFRERENLTAVVEEIKRYDPRFVFFCDDYFASYGNTERSKKIMSLMLQKLDRVPPWGAQVRSDVARDEDWLRLAKRSNCLFLCIGFESITPKSLKEAHKGQTVESLERDVANFQKYGLKDIIHGSFIIGFDADDKYTALRTMKWAKKKMNTIQIGMVTPLPGTEFREKLKKEGRLLPEAENPELCDGLHALYLHPNMRPSELQESVEKAGKRFSPFLDNIYLTIRGFTGWAKDWLMHFKNIEMAKKNFRKPLVRWKSWKTYAALRKQGRKYLKNLRHKG